MALNPLGLAPLAVVAAVVGVVVLGHVDESWDRALTRFARRLFGRYVEESPDRRRLLRSAYYRQTYRAYAARTFLYTGLAAVAGAISGAYFTGGLLLAVPAVVDLLLGLPRTMVNAVGLRGFELVLTETQTFLVVTAGGVAGGMLGAGLTYVVRWQLPANAAAVRRRNVDEGLARTVAFMYALSRGGVPFPQVMRTVAEHDEVYGETARETSVAVREMGLFGRDMITAVRRTAARTPSEEFKTFAENLASVLQSGRSLSSFLEDQYDRYQREAADRQEEVLERLATVAEAYVTILVAGVLFLITILLVFGLTTTDTLWLLQILGYVAVPLANLGFVVYLTQKLDALGIPSNETTSVLQGYETTSPDRPRPATSDAVADGGTAGVAGTDARAQLALYDRVSWIKRIARSPVETLLWYPSRILYLTVPLAAAYVLYRAPAAFATGIVNVRLLDDVIVQAVLFVLATFAVVRELYVRRVRRIEAATPDLLERMASLNEAGMTVVESLERLRGTDVGVLTPEVERIWADVSTGSNVEDALVRFGRRVRTAPVTRVVVLLSNAMRASGKLGPVLRIAATQARADYRLRDRRRQQMLSYLVVIYVSFAVFLVIIVAVQEVLVPSLPSHVPTPADTGRLGVSADQFARLGQVDKAAYTLVFFHVAIIQAVLSGFVGGLLGEGSLRDGTKHAAILLGVAYVAFVLLSSPVASLTVDDPTAGQDALTVDSASLSEGGFVVVHRYEADGPVVGQSEYLTAGTHADVRIPLDSDLDSGDTLVAVVHRDTDGNEALAYDGETDARYPQAGQGEFVQVTVEVP